MNEIRLNSKVVRMVDYRKVDLREFAVKLDVDDKVVKDQLVKYITRFSKTVECESIEKRDLVDLSCKSELPRYNKENIKIRVGIGLMGKEFEGQLIGVKKGETRTVTVSEKPVEVSIRKIERDILPKVDDDFVKRCNIPGVSTASDLENYCLIPLLDAQLDEPADNASASLGRQVFDNSEFELDDSEVKISCDDTIRQFSQGDGGDAIKQYAGQISASTLKAAAFGQDMLEKQGKLLSQEDYEKYIGKRANSRECSIEEIKKEEPVTLYAIHEYSDVALSLIETYATVQVVKFGREEK